MHTLLPPPTSFMKIAPTVTNNTLSDMVEEDESDIGSVVSMNHATLARPTQRKRHMASVKNFATVSAENEAREKVLRRGWCGTLKRVVGYFEEGDVVV